MAKTYNYIKFVPALAKGSTKGINKIRKDAGDHTYNRCSP